MELTDLLQVLPHQALPTMQPGLHRGLRQPSEYPGFIAPPLRSPGAQGVAFNRPFVVIAAPGAVGKSTLAAHIASNRAAALWDLSQLVLGDNTFIGTLASAFGASQLGGIIAGVQAGKTFFVFDALDEAELLSGWNRVESFVRELWQYLASANHVSAVLLARSETAQMLDLLLSELAAGTSPRHHILEIDFFDEPSAKRFVERQLTTIHGQTAHTQHPEPFTRALKQLFDVLAKVLTADSQSPWTSHTCRSFLGYAPVLQAIAAYLAGFQNYQEVLPLLEPDRFGATQSDLLPRLMGDLLERERGKLISAVRARPRPSDSVEPDWSRLYTEAEQLRRVFGYITQDDDALRAPSGLSPWMTQVYEEAVGSFLPNHPFLRGRAFAGPAFQDYTYASLLSDEDQALFVETWIDQGTYAPTPLFAAFYLRECAGLGVGTHAGLLYESAAAQFGLDCTSLGALVNPEQDAGIHTLAIVPEGDIDDEAAAFRINLRVDDDTPLVFRQRLRSAVLTVEGRLVLVGKTEVELADVEIQAKEVDVRAPLLTARALPRSSRVLIQAELPVTASPQLRIEVREPADLRVNWPSANLFPWAVYYDPELLLEQRDRKGAFTALQRVLRWFRKDRRDSLARYRELIDNVVVGHSTIRAEMVAFLLRKSILKADTKFYSLDGGEAVRLGINWASLRGGEPNGALVPLLDEFLDQLPPS